MRKLVACLVGFFLALSLASAVGFDVKKNSSFVETSYLGGDVVAGILNISFDKQENLYFTNSLNKQKIKLLEVFNATNFTKGKDYSCDPISCQSYYVAYGGESGKTISLGDEKELYGFKIKENKLIKSVEDLTFSVDVFVNESCYNQIFIDLFNDDKVDFYNTKAYSRAGDCGDTFYPEQGRNRGCFDDEEITREVPIGEEFYCEYMKNVPPAASYEIGGDIDVKKAGGSLSFVMYPAEGGEEPIGWAGYKNILISNETVGVIVNHSALKAFDAVVCVYTDGNYASDYFSIAVNEDKEEACGFVFEPGDVISEKDFDLDYNLYIKPRGYAPVDTVIFNKDLYKETTGRNLKDDLTDYINQTYGMNCSGENGCVIPFGIWGKHSDKVQSIYDADLKYKTASVNLHNDSIYNLNEKPAKVSSNWLKMKVENLGFNVPEVNGKYTWALSLGDKEVISSAVSVSVGFSFDVTPKFAYIGRETAFIASSNVSVTSSVWDFGDETPAVSVSGNSAKHSYGSPGEYTLKVTLIKAAVGTGTQKNSTKRLKVVVGKAKDSADLTLKDYEARVAMLESEINNYPSWVQAALSTSIGLDAKKTLVQNSRQTYDSLGADSSDSDYIAVVNDLLGLDLPSSIYVSSAGALPGDVGYGQADMSQILEIAGANNDVSDKEDLKSKVFGWMAEYYDLNISFETISAREDLQDVELLKKYRIDIAPKKSFESGPVYLIINYPKSGLVLASQTDIFSETSTSGGTYVDLTSNELSSVEFLIAGASTPSIMDLGVYISPSPQNFGADIGPVKECWLENCDPEGNFLWNRFLIGLGIIVLLFLMVYLFLQGWYRRSYEKHLFPNPNDLYNLLNFVYNSRRNGLKDSEIKASLKSKKWTSEQITYTFRKLEGKRTGMWEIPIFKFAENRKVRKELEKQQGGRPLDTRFIKRPNL